MSLVFDSFSNMEQAHAFKEEVRKRFRLDGQVFDDEDAAFAHDPTPYDQRPLVVHIDRVRDLGLEQLFNHEFKSFEDAVRRHYSAFRAIWDWNAKITDEQVKEVVAEVEPEIIMVCALEGEVQELVKQYGGVFVGT